MTGPLEAAVVFDDLIGALTEIRDGYILDEERWTDPTEIAEAFRYVGQVLSASSELFWEGDPAHPRFASIVSPSRIWDTSPSTRRGVSTAMAAVRALSNAASAAGMIQKRMSEV